MPPGAVAAILVGIGGWALQHLEPAGPAGGGPAPDPALAGRGGVVAVFGGFRAVAADLFWIRANAAWERRDLVGTETWVRAAVAADPRAEFFALNAARIIAHDFPTWRCGPEAPAGERARVEVEQAERALAILRRTVEAGGGSPAVWIEMALLRQRVLGDRRGAAACYRRAAELPDAPDFAGRMHLVMLMRMGEIRAARDWLMAWTPRQGAGEGGAGRDLAATLAELEVLVAVADRAGDDAFDMTGADNRQLAGPEPP